MHAMMVPRCPPELLHYKAILGSKDDCRLGFLNLNSFIKLHVVTFLYQNNMRSVISIDIITRTNKYSTYLWRTHDLLKFCIVVRTCEISLPKQ